MKYIKLLLLLFAFALLVTSCITDSEDETVWIKSDSTGVSLYSVDMLTNYFSYAAGSSGEIRYFNGSNWFDEESPTTSTFKAVGIISSTNVIAITENNIYKFNGVSWSEMVEPDAGYSYYSLTTLDANHIWVGGDDGQIHFYDGSSWTTIDLDYGDIDGIYAVDEENVFAFDEYGKVIFYNGIGWIELTDLDSSNFNSIFAFSKNDIWIAGYHEIYHFNGSEWQEISNSNEYNVNDIYGLSSDNVWFACSSGIILHWNCNSISEQSTPTTQNLYGIKMLDTKTGFAVGGSGMILKYNK